MWRQLRGLPLLAALALAACGSGLDEGQIGFVEGFFGGVIVDEPRAALVGRDVLSAGGSAADAAVATYFTLAVTMPGAASLGGGGVCLIHDRTTSRVEAIEFLSRRPPSAGANAGIGVPGNIRGMFLLHARYGRLNWADLLLPAENYARGGHAISRAFSRDLVAAAPTLARDKEARRVFALDGGAIEEGKVIRQFELSTALLTLRTRGPGEFYNGQLGRQFVEAVQATGEALTIADLRAYRPQLLRPIETEFGNDVMFFTPPPGIGGSLAAQVWAVGTDGERYADAEEGERLHLLSEVGARAYAVVERDAGDAADLVSEGAVGRLVDGYEPRRHNPAGEAPAVVDDAARGRHDGVSLVTVDARGQAVACSFTLNGPFGAEKVAPGTGIVLAAAPTKMRASAPAAALLANRNTDQIFLAAAISGGSPVLLAGAMLETLTAGQDLRSALTRPRAYNTGAPDVTIAEPGISQAARDFLTEAGYSLRAQDSLGRINGFHCPQGLPREPTCQFVAEPRAHGLAVSADEQ